MTDNLCCVLFIVGIVSAGLGIAGCYQLLQELRP
jgi:hypothetical protein